MGSDLAIGRSAKRSSDHRIPNSIFPFSSFVLLCLLNTLRHATGLDHVTPLWEHVAMEQDHSSSGAAMACREVDSTAAGAYTPPASPLGCLRSPEACAAGSCNRRVRSDGPHCMRALTLENGRLDEFAAVMPSFWDELALMAAPDAASGHSWTREMLVSGNSRTSRDVAERKFVLRFVIPPRDVECACLCLTSCSLLLLPLGRPADATAVMCLPARTRAGSRVCRVGRSRHRFRRG